MRKLLAVLLICAVALSVTACQTTTTVETDNTPQGNPENPDVALENTVVAEDDTVEIGEIV